MTKSRPRYRRLVLFVIQTLALAGVFSLLLQYSGLSGELFARIDPPVAFSPVKFESPRLVKVPQSPFLEAGRRSDGSIDSELMEARFRASGLSERQAVDIASHLLPLSTNIIAVNDPAFEAILVEEARAASDKLEKSYPRAHRALSQNNPPAHYDYEDRWTDFQVRMVWMSSYHHPHISPPPNKEKMQAAYAALFEAVRVSGLRALRVAPSDLSDPASIKRLAARITEANQGLQRATGWTGGVLGLGGRLELTVGSPITGTIAGVTVSAMRSDRLRITGQPHSLGHEWFHALDFTLGRQVLAAPTHETLSAQLAPFRLVSDHALAKEWKAARAGLVKAAPDWYRARKIEAILALSPYWMAHSETMAFAFQAHAAKTSHTLALQQPLEEYNLYHPHTYPTAEEVARQEATWKALFAVLRPIYQPQLDAAIAQEDDMAL